MNGWQCPTCGRVWAPYVMECPGPHTRFATSTVPNTDIVREVAARLVEEGESR